MSQDGICNFIAVESSSVVAYNKECGRNVFRDRQSIFFDFFLVESSRVAMVVGSPFFDFFAVVESRRCLQLTVRDFFFAVESSSGVDVEQNVWQKPIITP